MPRDKAPIRSLPGAFLQNPNDRDSPIYFVVDSSDKRVTVRQVGDPTEKAFTPKSLTHLVGSSRKDIIISRIPVASPSKLISKLSTARCR